MPQHIEILVAKTDTATLRQVADSLLRQINAGQQNDQCQPVAELCLSHALDRQALGLFNKLLADAPLDWRHRANVAAIYGDCGPLSQALSEYQKTLLLAPDTPGVMSNLAWLRARAGQSDRAKVLFSRALCLAPEDVELTYNYACFLLSAKDRKNGPALYDTRWKTQDNRSRPLKLPLPLWQGQTNGQKLIIWGEQGVGDQIFFANYLDILTRLGLSGTLVVNDRLEKLLQRSLPNWQCVSDLSSVDIVEHDAHIPMGALVRTPALKWRTPYLKPDPVWRKTFRDRYDRLPGKLKIGISWRGGTEPRLKARRSLPIKYLLALLDQQDVSFISLQYGDIQQETALAEEKNLPLIVDTEAPPAGDIDIFAAQVAALDLVISVQNTSLHLAGALGIPVWGLPPYLADWRWGTEDDGAIGRAYTNLRIFRQGEPGGWQEQIDGVKRALTARLARV